MQGNSLPLTLYGPKRLKEFVETALCLSGSWTNYPLIIVEVSPGLVFDEEGCWVTTYPLSHSMECYGYHIEQYDRPDTLDAARLITDGAPPGSLFYQLKHGQHITPEDDQVTNDSHYLGPAAPDKMLAIFGDTAPCSQALKMVHGADMIVHEATLGQAMAEKANSRGHSSSQRTAVLAREAGVGTLTVTRFSSRCDAEGCLKMLVKCREIFANMLLAENFMVCKMV